MSIPAAISTAGLTKHYPGVQALDDLTLEVPRARSTASWDRMARKDHGTEAARWPDQADTRHGFCRRHSYQRRTSLPDHGRLPQPGSALLRMDERARDPALHRLVVSGQCTARPRAGTTGARACRLGRGRRSEGQDLLGGMRQRLGIAQALVARPAVLLLDEPVSSLDPIGRHELLELMEQIKGEATVFYSTHILDDVQRVSDYVAISTTAASARSGRPNCCRVYATDDKLCSASRPTKRPWRWPPYRSPIGRTDRPRRQLSDLPDPHRPEREWRRAASCHAPRGRVRSHRDR